MVVKVMCYTRFCINTQTVGGFKLYATRTENGVLQSVLTDRFAGSCCLITVDGACHVSLAFDQFGGLTASREIYVEVFIVPEVHACRQWYANIMKLLLLRALLDITVSGDV